MSRPLAALALAMGLLAAGPAASEPAPARAVLAGGCFWCMESDFEKVPGVLDVVSGYTGGTVPNPTYEQTSAGGTGHAEAVEIRYDPAKIDYEGLLDIFWRNIDPLTAGRQFCDVGDQYRAAIFPLDEEQKRLALASKAEVEQSGRFTQPIVTTIEPAAPFYLAEDYHQDYYKKNPLRYKFYRYSCGRDARLAELWGPVS